MKQTSYKLTQPQERIWITQLLYPDSSMFHIGGYVLIHGEVQVEILREAIRLVVENNDIFYTQIVHNNTGYCQSIDQDVKIDVSFLDFYDMKKDRGEFEDWVNTQSRAPFSLVGAPLCYFAVFRLQENTYGYYVKLHHVISDGWSFQLITDWIAEIYEKLVHHRREEICLDFEQYRDFDYKEEQYLNSSRYEKNRRFWMGKLQDLPECIESEFHTLDGKRKEYHLQDGLKQELDMYCKANHISLNVVLLTAYAVSMSRLLKKKDFIIGVPFLGRNNHKENETIGMFVSSIPFRVRIDEQQTFSELLQCMRSEWMACIHNHKFPYNRLIKELNLRQRGVHGLYDCCFNYYNLNLKHCIDGKNAEIKEFYNGQQEYCMQMVVRNWDEQHIQVDIDYQNSFFHENDMDLFEAQFEESLRRILDDSNCNVGNLCEVHEEYQKLVVDFNCTETDFPSEKTIVNLFREQVLKSPEHVAVQDGDMLFTYRQLDQMSNQMTIELKERGISQRAKVGVLMRHSVETFIAILGILKAGAIFVPIDESYPIARIKFIVEDASITLVLTNMEEKQEQLADEIKCLYVDNTQLLHETGEEIDESKPEELAYILYTSGTTGKPKGVMIEHRGLVNYIYWAEKVYVRGDTAAFPLFTSLSFDLTITSIFTPLISGNRVVVYRDDQETYVLNRIIHDNQVRIVKLTPTHLSLLNDIDCSKSIVERFIVGGEQLTTELCRQISGKFSHQVEIYNEYGPSEAVVGCMIYRYDEKTDIDFAVPVGKPADNVKLYILDEEGKPVPKYQIGQLFIDSIGLARGYLNREELTNEKFVENPFIPGRRMYATGDLAKFISDDCIEYCGRKDQQIKWHGFRIELDEIRNCLQRLEKIKDSVTVCLKDKYERNLLCCYYVASDEIEVSEIRTYLKKELPHYMVPNQFCRIDAIPVTTNGKVDIRALPKITLEMDVDSKDVDAGDAKTKALLTVLSQIFVEDKITLNSNFIEMGGDSVQAIIVSSRLKEKGFLLKASDILKNPVVSDILESMKVHDMTDKGKETGSIQTTPIISHFLQMNHLEANYYHQSLMLKLAKPIHKKDLEEAFRSLILHHDSLRIQYDRKLGQIFYNNDHSSLQVSSFDLAEEDEIEERMFSIGKMVKESINIENGVLLAAALIQTAESEQYLLIVAHHLIIDGVSWSILMEDLEKSLVQIERKEKVVLPPKTSSYKEWAAYMAENASAESETIQEFQSNRKAMQYIENTYPQKTYGQSEYVKFYLDSEMTSQLFSVVRENSTITELHVLLLAVVRALAEFVPDQYMVDLEWNGRNIGQNDVDVSRTIGWFTSITPFVVGNIADDLEEALSNIKKGVQISKRYSEDCAFVAWYSSFRKEHNSLLRFNYLGNYSTVLESNLFKYSDMNTGKDVGVNNYMENPIEVNIVVVNSMTTFQMYYNKEMLQDNFADIFPNKVKESLFEQLKKLSESNVICFTTMDFDTVSLTDDELQNLFE